MATNNQLVDKIRSVIELGISQKRISEEINISQSTISNILSGRKSVSQEKCNILSEFLILVLKTCKNQDDFDEQFNYNKTKASKEINKLLKEGSYKCYYHDENKKVKVAKLSVINRMNEITVNFNFEDKNYSNENDNRCCILREIESYIELHLTLEHKRNVHLFICYPDFPISFSLGMMFYIKNHAPITSKIIIEFIGNENLWNDTIEKDITKYFANKYLSRLKLPAYPIMKKEELRTKLWHKQKDKGWETIYLSEFHDNPFKYDLFISIPINSISYSQFENAKSHVAEIVKFFKDKHNYKIFCQAVDINSKDEFDFRGNLTKTYIDSYSKNIFANEVTFGIKNSSNFIFIDIEAKNRENTYQSAQIFQIGWVLGQSTKNMVYFFVDDSNKIPILMRNENLKNFKIIEAHDYISILNYLKNLDSNVFSIEVFEEETFVIK